LRLFVGSFVSIIETCSLREFVAVFVNQEPMHTMNKLPRSVTVISWIFIAAGVVGFAYHATEFKTHGPFQYDLLWVCLVRLLAVLSGLFMLRGRNWARWLLLAWTAFHVILSAFHSLFELVVHGLLFAVVAYFLLCRQASVYFRGASVDSAQIPTVDEVL
jgi:hypothetical protein